MLELKNLYKKYQLKDVWAIKDVSLQVARGELLALVGESGSGKTTLLRLIAGFEMAEKGSISIHGREVFGSSINLEPEKRHIGMVFQDYALFPHLTIRHNITFGLKKLSRQQQQARLEEMLDLVGLQTQAQKYPHELSGGQQQRVALARALAPQPDILLLDEPFSNLDEVLKEQMRRDMRRIIKESGTTALFVTHDTRDALTTADRIIILKDGSIHQAGSPQQLYENPANSYVAGFFGQVNLVPARRYNSGYDSPLGFIPQELIGKSTPAEIMLCLRPEHIQVCSSQEATFNGSVSEIMYLGSHQRIRLQLASCTLLLDTPPQIALTINETVYCKFLTDSSPGIPFIVA